MYLPYPIVLDTSHAHSRHERRHAFASYLSLAGFTSDHRPSNRAFSDALLRLQSHGRDMRLTSLVDSTSRSLRFVASSAISSASPHPCAHP